MKDQSADKVVDAGDRSTQKQPGQDPTGNEEAERSAGPEEMDNPPRKWRKEDQESDESFPASDPPGNY